MLVFGAGVGALDVAINIQAIIVERASGRPMMSGFHGQFSLGGIVGAAGVTALLGAGSSPLAATLCVSAAILVLLALAAPYLLPYGARRDGPAFAVPHGVVLFIGALCFIVFLAEGAVLDWSAVFLTSARGMDAVLCGVRLCRLRPDHDGWPPHGRPYRAAARRQQRHRLRWPLRCTAASRSRRWFRIWQIALLGYALVGVGCSNVVPVLFTSVGRQTVMPEHVAVPAITTLGYAGILAGPALIGLVAHAASLSIAFLMLAIMLLGVAAGGRLRII